MDPVARTATSLGDSVPGGAAVLSPELGSEPDQRDTELPRVLLTGLSLESLIVLQL